MNNFARFASLTRPESIGYLAYADSMKLWDQRRTHRPIALWAAFYETYGDGNVQHSAEVAVQDEMLGDFCASFAAYLLDHPEDMEIVGKMWPHDLSRADLAFAADLRHTENKRRYYCLNERKVSAAEGKRHDKRWEEVPGWADGSLSAICGILKVGEGRELIAVYAAFRQVARYLTDTTSYYCNVEAALKITDEFADQAFSALEGMALSWRHRDGGRRSLECWQHNQENQRHRTAEKLAAQPA